MHPLPEAHRAFLSSALPFLQADPRTVAIAISGSAVTGGMDEWSDLDLVVFVEDAAEAAMTNEHFDIAARVGPLLSAFRGDHVGEPRLLICLYDAPLLHVDLKFMAMKDAPTLRYATEVVWFRTTPPVLPGPGEPRAFDVQWCADRAPTWAHYIAVKVARGELFEALHSIDYLRTRVLAPLVAVESGATPRALRRLEETSSPRLAQLARTASRYDREDLLRAAHEAFDLAWSLLDGMDVTRNRRLEERAMAFLDAGSGRETNPYSGPTRVV